MRIQIEPSPEIGDSRVVRVFIICRQIGLELRILEGSQIRQVFKEIQIDHGEYISRWEDVEWIN